MRSVAALLGSRQAPGLIVFEGDSITKGAYLSAGQSIPEQCVAALPGILPGMTYSTLNQALPGDTVANMVTEAASQVDPFYSPWKRIHWKSGSGMIASLFGGTNDLFLGAGGSTDYNALIANQATWLAARRAQGWRTVMWTMLKRSVAGGWKTADWTAHNTYWRAHPELYDVLCDPAADAAFSDPTSLTYFIGDGVHPNAAGCAILGGTYAAPAIKAALGL